MKSRTIIVVLALVVLGGLFLTGTAESHVRYPETRIGVRSQNFTPDFEKTAPQNPDYISFEQFLTDNFTSSTLVIQKELDSTHLAYFGARYYDPTSGRFTNPDPFMGHLADPRSQFMYGYGFNNPLVFVDQYGELTSKDLLQGLGKLIAELPLLAVDAGGVVGSAVSNIFSEKQIYFEDYPFVSMLGESQAQRRKEGQSVAEYSLKGSGEVVFAVSTFGIGPIIVADAIAVYDHFSGKIGIDELDRRLSFNAGASIGMAAMGAAIPRQSSAPKYRFNLLNPEIPGNAVPPVNTGQTTGLMKFLRDPAGIEELVKTEEINSAFKEALNEFEISKTTWEQPVPATKSVVGETETTAIGKSVHKIQADIRRSMSEFDLVQSALKDKYGNPILVSKRVNLKTGQPYGQLQEVIPDAVSFKRGLIIDDKPLGRPLAKDRQEIIRSIRAYEIREGCKPKIIAIQRYNPATGRPVHTELFAPEDFLP